MDNRRIPVNVSVNPSEHSGRSFRLGNSDIRDKMSQRMREFEEESRKWRDQFLSTSGLSSPGLASPTLLDRPRMFLNFPEFPELSSGFNQPLSSTRSGLFASPFGQNVNTTSNKSFIEEDDHANKKYKIQFDIGDFNANEIQIKTEGRQLIVRGDRQLVAGSATESKQFNREITLPEFVEPTSVTSFLADGVLTVEAPVMLDRLGYNPTQSISQSSHQSSMSSSSNPAGLRNSPFRDSQTSSIASRNYTRDELAHAAAASSSAATTSMASNASTLTSQSQHSQHQHQQQQQQQQQQQHSLFNTSGPSFDVNAREPTLSGQQPAIYKFNMSEFRPEDIAITVTDTTLKIHAIREEMDLRGAGKTYREFKREIGLPQGADVKRLKNSLQSDGTLTIEIPVQDNFNFRPPLSPTTQQPQSIGALNRQFNQFSMNDSAATAVSQQQQQQQQQQQTSSSLHSSSSNSHLLRSSTNNGALIDQTNTGKELRLTFDLTGYKPEDVNIKVIDNNTLKVHAVHIDNTRGNQIHREYTRQYILPDWVQPELLRARMSEDGTLTVEVPLPQVQPSKCERVINIQNSNRC